MTDYYKLSENQLGQISGGSRKTVTSGSDARADIMAGPGTDFTVLDTVAAGSHVFTTGDICRRDGRTWYELSDGGWIDGALISG